MKIRIFAEDMEYYGFAMAGENGVEVPGTVIAKWDRVFDEFDGIQTEMKYYMDKQKE